MIFNFSLIVSLRQSQSSWRAYGTTFLETNQTLRQLSISGQIHSAPASVDDLDQTHPSKETQLKQLQAVESSLDALLRQRATPLPEVRVLKQLYFDSMYSREDSIHKAEGNTFQWILDEEDRVNEEGREGEEDGEYKENCRTNLRDWLRTGNWVFHISGKAGSGKSTLMKYLFNHTKTREELKKWAQDGEAKLIFAQFFFWNSGSELQRSLQGLYRSILFEVLRQCPHLVREVFCEAFDAFSRTRPEDSIDKLFFRPSACEAAFKKLISKAPYPGYRFCFFIDGLDEYNARDDQEYQNLASNLNGWAATDGIKILASSRPYEVFKQTFSVSQRIELHRLTKGDIRAFCLQMFEKHRHFVRVKGCYKDLVDRIVERSEGVFLWARLAVGSLLNSVARYDPVDSLEKQLDRIPGDLNDFYSKIIESIPENDREKAFKMLLLVAEIPIHPFNAVAITWIDDLDDPDFPIRNDWKPYTEQQVQERHKMAESQVDGLTKGLLEIRSKHTFYIFESGSVEFLHRTVRDFVRQSSQLQNFSKKTPDLTRIETYARLFAAELWLAPMGGIPIPRRYINILQCNGYQKPRDVLLRNFDKAFFRRTQLNEESNVICPLTLGSSSKPRRDFKVYPNYFLCLVAYHLNEPGFVVGEVSSNHDILTTKDPLSPFLSAAFNPKSEHTLKALLDIVASANLRVTTTSLSQTEASIWMIYCGFLAQAILENRRDPMYLRLGHFLASGADRRVFFLLVEAKTREHAQQFKCPTHVISLRELIEQANPPNLGALKQLMESPRTHALVPSILMAAWNYLWSSRSREASREICTRDYVPFNLQMQSYRDKKSESEGNGSRYYLHSVWCGGEELLALDLKFRLT